MYETMRATLIQTTSLCNVKNLEATVRFLELGMASIHFRLLTCIELQAYFHVCFQGFLFACWFFPSKEKVLINLGYLCSKELLSLNRFLCLLA